jgi:CBS domain-containing protein
VYEVMSKPVITLDAEMDIKYAVRLLYRFGLSRAIVVEDGALVGLVTLRDLVLRYVDATART